MPTPIKEYREFFLRHTQVSSGAKADQETSYPLTYSATIAGVIKTVYNRFLKNDYPSEGVFKKLYESITFKLNQEDTAKLAEQGLVKIATDVHSETRTSPLSTTFTEAVVPHQLPDPIVTIDGATDTAPVVVGTDNGVKITSYRRTIAGLFKRIFRFEVVVQDSITIDGVTKMLKLVNDSAAPTRNKFYGTDSGAVKGFHNIGVQDSIVLDGVTNNLKLDGDEASPGNNEFYGTGGTGVKGFYPFGSILPSGVILLWSGSIGTIPTGWLICDGTNSTPDLRDRFVVGAGGAYAVADTGGEASHTLSSAEMPAHTHGPGNLGGTTGNESNTHTHNYTIPQFGTEDFTDGVDVDQVSNVSGSITNSTTVNSASHTHNITLTTGVTGSTGGGGAHENRPPYYALAYIMKS